MAEFTRNSITQLIDSKVTEFINEHELLSNQDRILLACSGNLDSIFALHYLLSKSYNIATAHIDHLTRNGQSTLDAAFLEAEAKRLGIAFYKKAIDIKSIIKNSGNFQEVARKQRYRFFADVMSKEGYTKLITAHHGDDNVETMLMNLGRAGGIKAMRGISPKQDNLIRPFLCLRKNEIQAYVDLHNIAYVKDASNEESDYQRNYFRNEVIPVIEKKDEDWVNQTMKSISYMLKWEEAWNDIVDSLVEKKGALLSINWQSLTSKKTPELYLFHALGKYGFNMAQVDEILMSEQVGKKWQSHSHTLFKERENIEFFNNEILENTASYSWGEVFPRIGELKIEDLRSDKNKVVVPNDIDTSELLIRHKLPGDFVQLRGGKKKLKKLFTDEKWSNYYKLTSYVVARKSEVFWIENY